MATNPLLEGLMKGLANVWNRQAEDRYARRNRESMLTDRLAEDEALYQQRERRRPSEFQRKLTEDDIIYGRNRERSMREQEENLPREIAREEKLAQAKRQIRSADQDYAIQRLVGTPDAKGMYSGGRFSERVNAMTPEERDQFLAKLNGIALPSVKDARIAEMLGKGDLRGALIRAMQLGDKELQAQVSDFARSDLMLRQIQMRGKELDMRGTRASGGGGGSGRSRLQRFYDKASGKWFVQDMATGETRPLSLSESVGVSGEPADDTPPGLRLLEQEERDIMQGYFKKGTPPRAAALLPTRDEFDEATGTMVKRPDTSNPMYPVKKRLGEIQQLRERYRRPPTTGETLDRGLRILGSAMGGGSIPLREETLETVMPSDTGSMTPGDWLTELSTRKKQRDDGRASSWLQTENQLRQRGEEKRRGRY